MPPKEKPMNEMWVGGGEEGGEGPPGGNCAKYCIISSTRRCPHMARPIKDLVNSFELEHRTWHPASRKRDARYSRSVENADKPWHMMNKCFELHGGGGES